MGEPVGKASGRTFKPNGYSRPRPLPGFTLGKILHASTICKLTAVRSLEERFTHGRFATTVKTPEVRLAQHFLIIPFPIPLLSR
jgi:hypothetical protein